MIDFKQDLLMLKSNNIISFLLKLPLATVILDLKKEVLACNEFAEQLFGSKFHELVEKNLPIHETEELNNILQITLQGKVISNYELYLNKTSGEIIDVFVSTIPFYINNKISGSIIIFTDFPEQKNEELIDTLTSLPNKRMFENKFLAELEIAKNNDSQVALLHLDIDRFKNINELLGYNFGDELLINLSKKLSKVVKNEGFVARKVGDEFFIFKRVYDLYLFKDFVKRIIKIFESPFLIFSKEIYLTVNIGIAIYPSAGDNYESLMKNAAVALKVAKTKGDNNFQYYCDTFNIRSYKTFVLRNDLRKALKNGEFTLYFQPVIDVSTNRITGAEALIRWKHPELGFISPNDFIPIAEETGMIIPIGEWVLKTACHYYNKWLQIGIPKITISINLSPYQFTDPNIYVSIKSTIENVDFDPKNLMIELTESSLITDEATAILTVNNLKKIGIKVAIDDFGTGYSSLAYLKKFKFDCLKIDKSLIKEISVDLESKEIVSTITNLGKTLNMNVVAEGIETEEQFKVIQDLRCDYGQGYYFNRPIPSEDFLNLLVNDKFKTDKLYLIQPENV